jgi:hypothetical protein
MNFWFCMCKQNDSPRISREVTVYKAILIRRCELFLRTHFSTRADLAASAYRRAEESHQWLTMAQADETETVRPAMTRRSHDTATAGLE